MKEKLQANGNTVSICDANIRVHTSSCMFWMLEALQGVRQLIHP